MILSSLVRLTQEHLNGYLPVKHSINLELRTLFINIPVLSSPSLPLLGRISVLHTWGHLETVLSPIIAITYLAMTVLYILADDLLESMVKNGYSNLSIAFMSFFTPEYSDSSILQIAASQGDLQVLKTLSLVPNWTRFPGVSQGDIDGFNAESNSVSFLYNLMMKDERDESSLCIAVRHKHKNILHHCLSVSVSQEDLDAAFLVAKEMRLQEEMLILQNAGAIPPVPLNLFEAASKGDVERLQELLRTDIELEESTGRSALHYAALNGQLGVIRILLLDERFSLNLLDNNDNSALHLAAFGGHQNIVEFFLSIEGVIYTFSNDEGRSIAHLAALGGHGTLLMYLLNMNGTPFTYMDLDENSYSYLHCAALGGHGELARQLNEEYGFPVNDTFNVDCYTPLHTAAGSGHLPLLAWLCEHESVDPELLTLDGCSPLIAAVFTFSLEAVAYLIEQQGVSITAGDQGRNLLEIAVISGQTAIVESLLTLPYFDIMYTGNHGNSILHDAILSDNSELILWLLSSYDIDINIVNEQGKTPLMLALDKGMMQAANTLMQHPDLQINKTDPSGFSALFYAVKSNDPVRVNLVLQRPELNLNLKSNYGETAFHYAAEACCLDVFRMLYNDRRATVEVLSTRGDSLLHFAVQNRSLDLISFLIEQNRFDLNIKGMNDNTPFIVACSLRPYKEDMIRLLAEQWELDINARGYLGKSALHHSIESDCIYSLSLLIVLCSLEGIELNSVDDTGRTALHYAAYLGNRFLTRFLIREVAIDKTIVDIEGNTAYTLAHHEGYREVANLLRPPRTQPRFQEIMIRD